MVDLHGQSIEVLVLERARSAVSSRNAVHITSSTRLRASILGGYDGFNGLIHDIVSATGIPVTPGETDNLYYQGHSTIGDLVLLFSARMQEVQGEV